MYDLGVAIQSNLKEKMEDFKYESNADSSNLDQNPLSNTAKGDEFAKENDDVPGTDGKLKPERSVSESSAGVQESGELQSPESGCQEEAQGFKDEEKPQNASKASLKVSKGMTEKRNMWISGVVAVVCLIVTLIIYVSSSMGAVAMSALISIVTSFGLYTFIIYGVIYFLIKLFSQKK